MKLRILTSVVFFVAFAFPVLALDLHQARSSGQVGEKTDGYVVALKTTPEVQVLVADINAKRKVEYTRISKQNGQPIEVVAELAAQQIINNLEPGSSYEAPDGSWKTR